MCLDSPITRGLRIGRSCKCSTQVAETMMRASWTIQLTLTGLSRFINFTYARQISSRATQLSTCLRARTIPASSCLVVVATYLATVFAPIAIILVLPRWTPWRIYKVQLLGMLIPSIFQRRPRINVIRLHCRRSLVGRRTRNDGLITGGSRYEMGEIVEYLDAMSV